MYVTGEEAKKFESLENQTVAYITEMTMQMIDSFPDFETKQILLQKFKKSVNGKAKRNHISFFSRNYRNDGESCCHSISGSGC